MGIDCELCTTETQVSVSVSAETGSFGEVSVSAETTQVSAETETHCNQRIWWIYAKKLQTFDLLRWTLILIILFNFEIIILWENFACIAEI